ncbi:MAG: hypothetical protein SGJ13_11060 [Actinomycetota bacterium]|nr:hypothetical protein [Actinomycetota bacterium]
MTSQAGIVIARAEIAVAMADAGIDAAHIEEIEVVADELLSRAIDAGVTPVRLFLEPHDETTTVLVRCERYVDLTVEPEELREHLLQSLTVDRGQRRNAYGTTDLWAEVKRTRA